MESWVCPNTKCEYEGNIKEEEGECPKCGAPAAYLGLIDKGILFSAKKQFKKTGKTDMWRCPNANCSNKDVLEPNTSCPKCGAPAEEIDISSFRMLLRRKRYALMARAGMKEILASDEMSDEVLKAKIHEDMLNLAMHEAGTGWMRFGTLLTLNSTEQMLGAGFKALIDQNKIIIRQNELILRELKRLNQALGSK